MRQRPVTWARLPIELQKLLFCELSAETLLQLQLTCKSWRRVAEEFLYKDINLRIDYTGVQSERLIATLELPNNQYRLFVKTLMLPGVTRSVGRTGVVVDYTIFVMRVSFVCPNLTFIENEAKAIPWQSFYQMATSLHRAGYLQKVVDLGKYKGSEDALDIYNNAAVEFASTLQKLLLKPQPDFMTILDSNMNATDAYALGKRLKEFRCLQELTIHLPEDFDLWRIDQLLNETANSLNSLVIHMTETSARFNRAEKFEAPQNNSRFTEINTLYLKGLSILTDQDMICIMYKFPHARLLEIDCDYLDFDETTPLKDLQSPSVMCSFMDYLIQEKSSSWLVHLTTSSQIMNKIITQLSKKLPAVSKLSISACPGRNATYPNFFLASGFGLSYDDKKKRHETWLRVTMPTSNMKSLYQHTKKAFRQSIEKLSLCGKPSQEKRDDYELSNFSAFQCRQNTTLNDSLDYILSNYSALESLKLKRMILMPITTSYSSPKRQLEWLRILNCCVHPQILTQLSQRLNYVENMEMHYLHWIDDDGDNTTDGLGYTINMPFTEFGCISLNTFQAESNNCFVTIFTSTEVVRLHYDAGTTELTRLTEEELEQDRASTANPFNVLIYCIGSWEQFPKELQRIAFSKLQYNRNTLLQIQLTCKSWRQVAEELLYANISLCIDDTVAENEKLLTTLELPNNQYRLFVKTLNLFNLFYATPKPGSNINPVVLLLKLLLNCPNLTSIEPHNAVSANDYYDTIYTLRRAGHLQKVGFIGCYPDTSKKTLEHYNKTIMEFASTIQEVLLEPYPESDTLLANGSTIRDAYPLGKCLKEFLRLKKLRMLSPTGLNLCQLDQLLDSTNANALRDVSITMKETDAKFDKNEIFEALPGGQRFTKLGSVDIQNIFSLTDQDMLYIMYKFPSVDSLNIYCNYSMRSTPRPNQLPSTSVVCKFIAYLLQFSCWLNNMTLSTEALMQVVTQLSTSSPVTQVEVLPCPGANMNFSTLNLSNNKPRNNEISLLVRLPSSNAELLCGHLLGSFCQSLKSLTLTGPLDYDDPNENNLTALERSQNATLNDSIDTILNNHKVLNTLTLHLLALMPLSSSTINSSVKRQLETLVITECGLHPQFLSQLSQRIRYINSMHLFDVHWIQDSLDMLGIELGCTINMPFTKFNSIELTMSFSTSEEYLFKIWTGSRVVRFKFSESYGAHELLTEDEFEQARQETIDPWLVMIYCASCKSITVSDHTVSIDE
ncbi:hypothetical protein MBANPS3_000310 [Mucor bainieri]